jgi:hypothetical protein
MMEYRNTWSSDRYLDYNAIGSKINDDIECWLEEQRKVLKFGERGTKFFYELKQRINDVKLECYKHHHDPKAMEDELISVNNENVALKEEIARLRSTHP